MSAQGLGSGPIAEIVPLSGGTQNILLRLRRGERCFVLRRPPRHPRPESNSTMLREARMLAALGATRVPHPRLIATCPDEDILGVVFYLMEPVEGFSPTGGLPALHRDPIVQHRMGLALVEGIVALGAVDHVEVGLGDFGKPDRYLERQVQRWRAQLASYSAHRGWPGAQTLPATARIADWLEAHRPGRFEPGILHGDYHLGNVMYRTDSAELAAIVDWELTTVGDPLIDLGWLLATWPGPDFDPLATLDIRPWSGFPSASELIEHYRSQSRRDLGAIEWYAVLACYKLAIILEGTYARACAGLADPTTGERLHLSAVNLLERAVRRLS